jgi:hypothetical protein
MEHDDPPGRRRVICLTEPRPSCNERLNNTIVSSSPPDAGLARSEQANQSLGRRLSRNGPRAALVLGAEIKSYEFEERLMLRGWIVSPRRSMAKSSVIFAARFSAVFAW